MKRKNILVFLLAITLIPSLALAIYDWQDLRVNNIYSTVTNYGVLGHSEGDPGTYWPMPAVDTLNNLLPPLMNYVYGWGLWVGAQVHNDTLPGKMDTLVTIGYNTNNGTSEFTPGEVLCNIPQDLSDSTAKVYLSTAADWPLKKTNGQDSIISMCDTRCVYNDYLAVAHATGGRPLKVEVTQTTYQWDLPLLEDLIYFVWEIKNTQNDTLYDVYLAPTTDFDIGNEANAAANDVCFYDTNTTMAYQYQTSDYATTSGWTRPAGCVGLCLLETPKATKNYTFPDGYKIYKDSAIGLFAFKVLNIMIDPETDQEQYKVLAGYNYITDEFKRLDPKALSSDQRFIVSTGPADLAPGETIKLSVCLICAGYNYAYLNIDDTLSIDSLRLKARYAKTFYDQLGVSGSLGENTNTPLLLHQNAPNPFKQLTTINYQLAKPGLVNLKVYNIAGQLVKTLASGQVSAGLHTIKWDGRDNQGNKVSSGAYVYRLQAGNKDMTKKLVILK